jgi:hypothetical protein
MLRMMKWSMLAGSGAFLFGAGGCVGSSDVLRLWDVVAGALVAGFIPGGLAGLAT